jgi:hypothetical protein
MVWNGTSQKRAFFIAINVIIITVTVYEQTFVSYDHINVGICVLRA